MSENGTNKAKYFIIKGFFPDLNVAGNINEMKWDVLRNEIEKTEVFNSFKNEETFLEDKTMMKNDHGLLSKCYKTLGYY